MISDEFVENFVGFREGGRFVLAKDWVAAHQPEHLRGGAQAGRLGFIFAAVPSRVVPDRVDDDTAPAAVATGDLRRQTRQRHKRVHEIGMRFAPEPGVHPAHRRAHHQPCVIYAHAIGQQAILRFDHVDVTVARKFGVQSIAWLARFAVTDAIWHYDKKFRCIEWLIFAEKFTSELRPDELPAVAGRTVGDQDSVGNFAGSVFVDLAERPIMNFQLGQGFAGSEFEIANRVVAFGRRKTSGGKNAGRND